MSPLSGHRQFRSTIAWERRQKSRGFLRLAKKKFHRTWSWRQIFFHDNHPLRQQARRFSTWTHNVIPMRIHHPAAGSQGVTRCKGCASAALPHPCPRVIVFPLPPPGWGSSGQGCSGCSPAGCGGAVSRFPWGSPRVCWGSLLLLVGSAEAVFPRAAVAISLGWTSRAPLIRSGSR